jgi:hypothetical protein
MTPPPADLTPAGVRGGTFVRPGAFAWGRPAGASPSAIGPTAIGPTAIGPSAIEDLLAAAAKDPDLIDHLPTVTYLGAEFVPAFTSPDRLTCWSAELTVPHIVVPAASLASLLPPGLGIALNPGGEPSVPIYPDGVRLLASAGFTIEHPPADPVALLAEVRAALREVTAVRHASRAWLTIPGQREGLVISVALRDPADRAAHDAVIAACERAASLVPHQFALDVTFPGETAPHELDHWIAAHATPFYTAP